MWLKPLKSILFSPSAKTDGNKGDGNNLNLVEITSPYFQK